jgi:hypothetical protein
MKKIVQIFGMAICISIGASAQQTTFQKDIGGAQYSVGTNMKVTADSGFIMAGITMAFGAGGYDFYVIKTNHNGDTDWTRTYGGAGDDEATSVQQTTDGGYIIAGYSNSFTAGNYAVYLVKTNSKGDTLWTKTYGGLVYDEGSRVEQTKDGGYIIVGNTKSYGQGQDDIYLIKTNALGDTTWTKVYGGTGDDLGNDVQQTADLGYIITGQTNSFGAGGYDVYLIKTNANGDTTWTKTYGGPSDDLSAIVRATPIDGGYIIVGATASYGFGSDNIYVIKTNANGDTLWNRTYGGTSFEYGNSIELTKEGGYIIGATTHSFGFGNDDAYLIKINSTGDTLFSRVYGSPGYDYGCDAYQTVDGGFVMSGLSSLVSGNGDVYLIKTDSMGNTGCNTMDAATLSSRPHTQISKTGFITSHGSVVLPSPALVSFGGTLTSLCAVITTDNNTKPLADNLEIYPNPNNGIFTIALSHADQTNVEIYNVLGEKVYSQLTTDNSQLTVNISGAPSGIYFYRILKQTGELIGSGKMIIQK